MQLEIRNLSGDVLCVIPYPIKSPSDIEKLPREWFRGYYDWHENSFSPKSSVRLGEAAGDVRITDKEIVLAKFDVYDAMAETNCELMSR